MPSPHGEGGAPLALNPLSPCGVCREHLLKIAEVQPELVAVSFDDVSMSRVIVRTVVG